MHIVLHLQHEHDQALLSILCYTISMSIMSMINIGHKLMNKHYIITWSSCTNTEVFIIKPLGRVYVTAFLLVC